MTKRRQENRRFLTSLFAGPFRGHAILMDHEHTPAPGPGDFTTSDLPLSDWVDWHVKQYEGALRFHEALDDDSPRARSRTR